MAWLIRWLGGATGADTPLKALFLLMSFSIPLLIALTARRLFDPRAARFCFWAATLYAPFWMYGSFLLAELPLAFLVSLCAWVASLHFVGRPEGRQSSWTGLLLGLTAGSALAFKITPLPAVCALLAMAFIGSKRGWIPRDTVRRLRAALIVFLVFLAALSARGSWGTGRFNMGTNKFPGDFLIGNHGKIGLVEFRGGGGTWGSPTAGYRGWNHVHSVPHAMWSPDAIREGMEWIRANPDHAVGMNHLKFSAFLFDPPWPFSFDDFWVSSYISTFWMSTLGFFLAVLGWWMGLGSRGPGRSFLIPESFLAAPVLALMFSLLLTSAEARYRVPLDPLILLLAGSGFSRLLAKRV